jgi:biotin transporter BioY
MNIFTWLFLGHLLGDWLLQNDWMAQGKRQGLFTTAGLTHVATYTAVLVGILWLAGGQGLSQEVLVVAGGIIFVTHWLIDATDVVQWWMRFYGQRDQTMVRLMIDQTWHLLVLGLLVPFL